MVTSYCSLVLCEDIITCIYKVIIGWTQGLVSQALMMMINHVFIIFS